MSIEDIIAGTGETPITVERISRDLRSLGVESGMNMLVHSSLSSLGYVCGGAMAVVLALQEVVGESGTLMMPAMAGEWSDPGDWERPAVPQAWHDVIRDHWPAWDTEMAMTYEMGAVAETFRRQREVLRSGHPNCSFTARGPNARFLTQDHGLDHGMDDQSPLGKLYDLKGHVLLLGVGHANNSSLHLAENRANYPKKAYVKQGAAMRIDGKRQWVVYETLDLDSDDFKTIGAAFEKQTDHVKTGPVGLAESRLMRQRPLVDFGSDWMNQHR